MNQQPGTPSRRWLAVLCCALPLFAISGVHAQPIEERFNIGSMEDWTDGSGRLWKKDPYDIGRPSSIDCTAAPILQSTDDDIYCSNRYFTLQTTNNEPFILTAPVSQTGDYRVLLHFAETWFGTSNRRIFDVYLQDKMIAQDLDLVAEAGVNTAYVLDTVVGAVNEIKVELVPVKQNPIISAIEVIYEGTSAPIAPVAPVPTAAPVALPQESFAFRMNVGSRFTWVDPLGRDWVADSLSFGIGATIDCTIDPIAKTNLDELYCSHKWFNNANSGPDPYLITVPVPTEDDYRVRLHFAETHFDQVFSRTFNVMVQGVVAAYDLDVFSMVGKNAAYVVELIVPAIDSVDIALLPVRQNPMISAVEIVQESGATPTTPAPMVAPTPAPVVQTGGPNEDILINVGGNVYTENAGLRTWQADNYFTGGTARNFGVTISNTLDDKVYQSERHGDFTYEVPVPPGDYEIVVHLAEVFFQDPGRRIFTLVVEGEVFESIDIFAIGGFANAFTLEVAKIVDDGFVSIQAISIVNNAKVSGIEIIQKEIHTAHAVSQGPYTVVDKDNDGFGVVSVDASPSHTHGPGLVLTDWIWKEGATTVGTGELVDLTFPVGVHNVALTVIDSGSNDSTEQTTITVLPFGYPDIESLSPTSGSVSGGYEVIITGSGFTFTPSEIIVHFGLTDLTGADLQIIDANTIKIIAPMQTVAVPVQVSVESIPLGATSNSMLFTYETAIPITWTEKLVAGLPQCTVAAFSPNGKLYVGTSDGKIAKIAFDFYFNFDIVDAVISLIDPNRAILGMAFDPMTTADDSDPWVYFSASDLFHGGSQSSSGNAINGKIMRAKGANLDIIEDVVTGLPVADMDHAVNGIEFGDNGELYIQIGSNTNGGIPGQLTGNQIQKENYFSAATNVAYLSDANFNGNIQYSAADDGLPTTTGVEVFASGERNPFGICLHSNGYLYGTDNGPNLGYGDMKTGCGANNFIPDVETEDKINILLQDGYYGHPNPVRASTRNEPRQCKWRSPEDPTDAEYIAPLVIAPSSTGAIIEFQSDHFGGQMRGNLIYSKYTSKLYRVILRADGKSVIPQSVPPIGLVGKKGLGVTQAPDGSLIQVQYSVNEVWAFQPDEEPTDEMRVNAVFPRRGPSAGGSTLHIYGTNMEPKKGIPKVTVGGSKCSVISFSARLITCILPGGSGTVDITVDGREITPYTFRNGYRFISGVRK